MFLKNRNTSSKIKRSKVTDYAALSRLICMNKGWFFAWRAICLLCTCFEMNGLLAKRRDFNYILNKPSIASVIELGRCNVTFWLTSWTWFIRALHKMFKLKTASKHRGTCSILDVGTVWRSWRRCTFFIRTSFLINALVKSFRESSFCVFFFFFFVFLVKSVLTL